MGYDQNKIDFRMSSDRQIVGNCEVMTKVDIGSDHRMVRARAEINKKVNETTQNAQTNTTQIRS